MKTMPANVYLIPLHMESMIELHFIAFILLFFSAV